MKEWLLILLIMGGTVQAQEADDIYDRYLAERDLSQDDTITCCYEGLFFLYLYRETKNPDVLERGEEALDLIIGRQEKSGEITNDPNVNPKLYTGVGVWALSLGYEITREEKYKDAALKGGDFLIGEVDKWKSAYPLECPDERNTDARHRGEMRTSLENYCYSCPNDWGLICAGLGSIVYYTGERREYSSYAVLLGETLYRMQLDNGAWYDGYALKIPTRWNISSHYVAMAILGEWISHLITGDERYKDAVKKAVKWMEDMQTENGVYDLYITEKNFEDEKTQFAENPQRRCDFRQVAGQTNVKEYYSSPDETMLGEYSLFLAQTLAEDLNIATGREKTLLYIQEHHGYSQWYILSLVLDEGEPLTAEDESTSYVPIIGILVVGLVIWIVKRSTGKKKTGKR